MSVVKLKNDYFELAHQFIDIKSTYDDVVASMDIGNIYIVIDKLKQRELGSLEEAKQLHESLVKKYYSIVVFNNVLLSLEQTRSLLPRFPSLNQPQITEEDKYIDQLKLDSFGILSDVLMKHYIISEVKEIIDSVTEN